FVGAVGVTAGSAAILGASGQAVAANDKVRVGMIGSGSRGRQGPSTLLENAESDNGAGADGGDPPPRERASTVKKKRGNSPTTDRDYRKMLDSKDVDAVVIATPDHWHALPAIQAVLAGKDVYVEKPVAHNVAEGQAMLRAARKTNKIMAVG